MTPYLLFFALIVYGEFSKDIHTRFICRIIFYGYSVAIFLRSQLPFDVGYVYITDLVLVFSLIWSAIETPSKIAKGLLMMCSLLVLTLSTGLYFRNYALLLQLPFMAEYSNIVIRESILAGIAMTNYVSDKDGDERDWKLNSYMLLVWMFEKINLS